MRKIYVIIGLLAITLSTTACDKFDKMDLDEMDNEDKNIEATEGNRASINVGMDNRVTTDSSWEIEVIHKGAVVPDPVKSSVKIMANGQIRCDKDQVVL